MATPTDPQLKPYTIQVDGVRLVAAWKSGDFIEAVDTGGRIWSRRHDHDFWLSGDSTAPKFLTKKAKS